MLAFFTNAAARVRNEKGATAVEYGIMVALIAVAIIAAVTFLGDGLTDSFNQIACDVNGGGTYKAGEDGAAGSCTKS